MPMECFVPGYEIRSASSIYVSIESGTSTAGAQASNDRSILVSKLKGASLMHKTLLFFLLQFSAP